MIGPHKQPIETGSRFSQLLPSDGCDGGHPKTGQAASVSWTERTTGLPPTKTKCLVSPAKAG